MIERAAEDPLLVFGWVTGDEAYGDNTRLRARCRSRPAEHRIRWSRWRRRHRARARRCHYQRQLRLIDH